MFREHPAREFLDFAECNGFKATGPLKPQTEPADAAE
jgi:hypothetical protein